MSGELAGGVPHNRLGGISAIEHVTGNRYLLLSDRGPADGATDWICRFHTVEIDVDRRRTPAVALRLISTTTLRDGGGRNLVGSVTAFDPDDPVRDLRFDPEGIRQTRGGRLFISDEYGPSIYEFSTLGSRTRMLPIPRRFRIANRSALSDDENSKNVSGRQANGGLEGLAITPDGTKLYGAMQRPLIQESRPAGKKRVGLNT
ncbi:MAG TPA: esterase-like activity of phytase family protein, partial [Planctomycetaceae bacterium]|nr:esterase-like activity of phytase family protein [Planctomycetaceae bacterium]